MNAALWISAWVLAATFLASGAAKSALSKERLIATGQTGVTRYPIGFVRLIAALEILGAIGLILPRATVIASWLTPAAAIGIAAIMVGAAGSHWSLGERTQAFTVNLVLFLASAFVAVGRIDGW